MKIAVIGAGIHGICTAYELVSQGHRVEVFERNGSAAEEASFANGSLLSAYALSSLLDQVSVGAVLGSKFKSSPVLQWQGLSPSLLRWAWQTHRLRHSPLGASRRRDLQNLAQWSQSHLLAVCNAFRQDIDQSEGVLLLMRSAQDQQRWAGLLHEIVESGLENSVLNREQTQTIEPALREDTPLHQAVWLAQDGSANCRQFGLLLKSRAEEMGVVSMTRVITSASPALVNACAWRVRTRSANTTPHLINAWPCSTKCWTTGSLALRARTKTRKFGMPPFAALAMACPSLGARRWMVCGSIPRMA